MAPHADIQVVCAQPEVHAVPSKHIWQPPVHVGGPGAYHVSAHFFEVQPFACALPSADLRQGSKVLCIPLAEELLDVCKADARGFPQGDSPAPSRVQGREHLCEAAQPVRHLGAAQAIVDLLFEEACIQLASCPQRVVEPGCSDHIGVDKGLHTQLMEQADMGCVARQPQELLEQPAPGLL